MAAGAANGHGGLVANDGTTSAVSGGGCGHVATRANISAHHVPLTGTAGYIRLAAYYRFSLSRCASRREIGVAIYDRSNGGVRWNAIKVLGDCTAVKPTNALRKSYEGYEAEREPGGVADGFAECWLAHRASSNSEKPTDATKAANRPFTIRIQGGLSVVISQAMPIRMNSTRANQMRGKLYRHEPLMAHPSETKNAEGAYIDHAVSSLSIGGHHCPNPMNTGVAPFHSRGWSLLGQ